MKKLALIFALTMAIGMIGCKNPPPTPPAPPPLGSSTVSPGGTAGGAPPTAAQPGTTAAVAAGKTAESKAAPGKYRTYVIGFSQCTFEDPWRINFNSQMEAAAKAHPEVSLIIANGENRNDKQISDVENFMVRGVDAIIISPREAAPLTAVVAKAYDRGIPVIVLDRRVVGDKYTCFIGARNLDIGQAAAQYLAGKLKSGKVVEIEGIIGATATQERHQGFRDELKKSPGLEVIYDQPGDYKRSPAKQIMDNALQANPKIDAVYAHNDEMAIGAFLAAKAAGRDQGLIIIGIDGQREAVKMIRNGLISATFVYPNGAQQAIETALKIFNHETVPREILLQTTRITKDENPDYLGFE
jgi:ribose transport system substrate-binding protein